MACAEPEDQPAAQTQGGGQDGADGVFFVSLSYKGSSYEVPVQEDDPLASIFDFAQEALDFPRENCKLIFRGKMLRPDNDSMTVAEAGLAAGSKVMLVASSARDISFVQSSRADPLVKGFVEEERDEQNRRKRARAAMQSAWGTKQDPEFCFGSIKAEFKYSEPPPYDAERLLKRLATDPGIIEIMKTRKFKVGVLTEMSPVEAQERMANRGTPNMDLLGYNQNYGGMIVLRLRTDSLKGFRPYHDLINTLIHELTHNVWGPHDQNFWKLFGELKAQYMRFHRFWSHGGQAADSNASGQFQGFTGDDAEGGGGANFGHTLGSADGTVASTEAQRRARALAAAEARTSSEGVKDASDNPFVPNFLASNGTWVFMCPCGQEHEVDNNDCPVAAASASTANAGTASGSSSAPAPATVKQDEAMEENQQPGTPEQSQQQPQQDQGEQASDTAAADAPAADSREAADIAMDESNAKAAGSDADVAMVSVESELKQDEVASGAVSTNATSRGSAAEVSDFSLDMAELESQGLDGAAVWLQRFSAQLKELCRPDGITAKASAMELLLRLVRNVVESPQEPKFRRIRADNPKVRAKLISAGEAAEALMVLLGFEATVDPNGERVFLLRDASFDCARLRMGQELLEMELEKTSTAFAR